MQTFKTLATSRLAMLIEGSVLALVLLWPLMGTAQDEKAKDPDAHAQQKDKQAAGDQDLAKQIAELRDKVARLESALKQGHKGMPSVTSEKGGVAGNHEQAGGHSPSDRASAKFQNCLQCHQARPRGPLPPSHLKKAGDSGTGTVEGRAAAGQKEPVLDKGMGTMGQGGKGMGGGMGMGMMGGKGMGMMSPGGKGMGGGMGMGMMGSKGMGMMRQGGEGMDSGKGMGMEDDKEDMDATGGGNAEMGGMSRGMKGMDMMEMMGVMGMAPKSAGGMAGMKSMGKMQIQAALPGFPGASHIYHVGATDFFLNHPEHLTLTPKQQGELGRLKEKAVLAKTSAQRKIDEAEQQLWTLTSADEPDVAKIEAKIQEGEKLRGDQRMALIRAVGAAAKVLTDEQRESLLGTVADETAKPNPHADHQGTSSTAPDKAGNSDIQDKTLDHVQQNDNDKPADAEIPAHVQQLQARITELEAALKARP